MARGGTKVTNGEGRRPWSSGSYWQDVVLAQVALAEQDLEHICECVHDDASTKGTTLDDVRKALDRARQAAESGCNQWAQWHGRPISYAFTNLHNAEVMLARHAPADELDDRLVPAMARIKATMRSRDPRRIALEGRLRAIRRRTDHDNDGQPSAAQAVAMKQAVLASAIESSYSVMDSYYARLRSFRNVVWMVTVSVLVLAAGLVVLGGASPDALELCFDEPAGDGNVCPTGAAPHRIDALVISVLGATGGAISAVIAITRMRGGQTPFQVPLALALLKPPFGAVTALAGLILIHGQFIPGLTNLDSEGQILAYALFFGIAQQILTGFVDRRAHDLVSEVPQRPGLDAGAGPSEVISDFADLVEFEGSHGTMRDGRSEMEMTFHRTTSGAERGPGSAKPPQG